MNAPDPDFPGHTPVLFQSVIHWLQPAAGRRYVDGTVGAGGHAEGLLAEGAAVLGLDRDGEALAVAARRLARFGERAILRQASYRRAGEILAQIGWEPVNGILLDLGLSSLQLAAGDRGFAFRSDGPLDMRFDRTTGETAADLLNTLPVEEIAGILADYGEERDALRIARAIFRNRPIETSGQLAEVIAAAVGRRDGAKGIHPATRTFQALRIAVNGELAELEAALPELVQTLAPGGRLAVISFHSLEDRIVKRFIRGQAGRNLVRGERLPPYVEPAAPSLKELTVKPVLPAAEETALNPRARSAKLRIAEKLIAQPSDLEKRPRREKR